MDEPIVTRPPRRLLATVRALAVDPGNIGWTDHARQRLRERDIAIGQALDVIRNGAAQGRPVLDEYNEWSLRLEKRSAGRRISVVVATDGHSRITVVTVI